MIEIDIGDYDEQLQKVRNFLKDMPAEFADPVLSDGLMDGAREVVRHAKAAAPVVTGEYKEGIVPRRRRKRKGGGIREAEAAATAPHSYYIEFGGADGDPPERNIMSNAAVSAGSSGAIQEAVVKGVEKSINRRIKKIARENGLSDTPRVRF